MPKITPENVGNATEDQLRTRLAELKGMKRSSGRVARDIDAVGADQIRARANAMMKYDPETAQAWLDKARELDIRAKDKRDPDTIRTKIQSAINSIRGDLANMTSEDPRRISAQKALDALIAEMQLDTPSLQHAYIVANGGAPKSTEDEVPDLVPTPTGLKTKTSTEYIAAIKAAGTAAEAKTIAQDATAKGIKGAELDAVLAAAKARASELTAPVINRPGETSKEVIAQINNQLKFLLAGNLVSTLDPKKPGDKQKIFKLGQRAFSDEAVNVGDVGLTKGYLDQFLAKMTGITGEISEDEVRSSIATIRGNYNRARAALQAIVADDPKSDYYSAVSKAGAAGVKQALADNKWAGGGAGGGSTGNKVGDIKKVGDVTMVWDGTSWGVK